MTGTTRTHKPRGALPARCAAVLAGAVFLAAGTGLDADGTTTTLHYHCATAGLPGQPMTAQVLWQGQTSVPAGRPSPAATVHVTATVGAIVASALGLIGTTSVTGGATVPGTVHAPDGDVPAALSLAVPRTAVPTSGPMTIHADGTTPRPTFHKAGQATIAVAGTLSLRFALRNAEGNPTIVASADLTCALDPGQNDVVFAFDVTAPPKATRAPATTPAAAPPATHGTTIPPTTRARAPLPAVVPTTTPAKTTTTTRRPAAVVPTTAAPTSAVPNGVAAAGAELKSIPDTPLADQRPAGQPDGTAWWPALVGIVAAAAVGTAAEAAWLSRRRPAVLRRRS